MAARFVGDAGDGLSKFLQRGSTAALIVALVDSRAARNFLPFARDLRAVTAVREQARYTAVFASAVFGARPQACTAAPLLFTVYFINGFPFWRR
jgi:hypothetical protein